MTPAELRLRRARRITSTTRPHALLELGFVTAVYLLFTTVQGDLGRDAALANRNADRVQGLERWLHLDVERAVNGWAAGLGALSQASAVFYALVLAAPPVVLFVLYLARPDAYAANRRSLVGLSFLSLPVFWLFPVAPPRLAEPGIADLVATHAVLGATTSPEAASHANLYAATPSLHVAWGVWCAYGLAHLLPRQGRLRLLPALFPLLVALDVVVTGNHYLVDVVLGGALTAVAVALDRGQVRRALRLLADAVPAPRAAALPARTGEPGVLVERVSAG